MEIEKKFLIDEQKINEIISGAEFVGQKRLVDIYYDTLDFQLTTEDWWLRNRNGNFELKKVLNGDDNEIAVDRYEEIADEKEICKVLAISFETSLLESLMKNKINSFCTIVSDRKKYKQGEFTLDFDVTDFGYSICEIELMVENETKIDEASTKIEKFRKENNLSAKSVRGKLVEYIFRNRPEHYQILQAAGVIRD